MHICMEKGDHILIYHPGLVRESLPEDADSSFFFCKELIPGYLDGITGCMRLRKDITSTTPTYG